jgi:hypothetical protein
MSKNEAFNLPSNPNENNIRNNSDDKKFIFDLENGFSVILTVNVIQSIASDKNLKNKNHIIYEIKVSNIYYINL